MKDKEFSTFEIVRVKSKPKIYDILPSDEIWPVQFENKKVKIIEEFIDWELETLDGNNDDHRFYKIIDANIDITNIDEDELEDIGVWIHEDGLTIDKVIPEKENVYANQGVT